MARNAERVESVDDLTPEQRRRNMRAIKGKDTTIELRLRRALWRVGIRYRKNWSQLPGKPDIVITRHRIVVFCDSEFWHGFDWQMREARIKSHRAYWIPKIERVIERDKYVNCQLAEAGWVVLRFWEREIHQHLDDCVGEIEEAISAQEYTNRRTRPYRGG